MSGGKFLKYFRRNLWVGLLLLSLSSTQMTADLQSNSLDTANVLHIDALLNETLCATKKCLNIGSQMLSFMDHTIEPCNDFYHYACGGLGNNPEMLEQDADKDVDKRLRGQIKQIKNSPTPYIQLKKFYDSCTSSGKSMNEVEARSVVGTVGLFHSKTSWEANSSDFTDLLVKLLMVGSTPLFDILLDVSDEDTTSLDLKLIAPMRRSLVLPDTDTCLLNEHPSSQHTYSECRQRETLNFIASIGEALQALNFFPIDSSDISSDDFQATIDCLRDDIVTVIEKYTPFESDVRRDLALKKYQYMNISELQSKYPLIDWLKLLTSTVSKNITTDSKVQVYFEHYFHMLFRHLSEVETRLLHNALLAMFVTEIYFDIVNHRSGNREEYCLTITKNLLPDVASSLYLQTFHNNVSEQVEEVFDKVKRALEQQINGSHWLDVESRESSLKRLAAIEVVAGGGKELLGDMNILNQRMAGYSMNKTMFLSNTIKLLKRKRKLTYALYFKETSLPEEMWTHFVNPLDSTVPIIYHSDKIVVPYAMLPVERLGKVIPQFKIAEMGMILAKLIAHHFDTTGINCASKGVNSGILSDGQVNKYSSIKECVRKQVSKLDRTIIKHRRDVLQTVNDVIADQIALNMALEAFKTNNITEQEVYEDDSQNRKWLQLFFLSMAQTSCTKNTMWDSPAPVYQSITLPPFARINLLINQSEVFSTAFGCTPGSGMKMPERQRCPTFPMGSTNEVPHNFPTFK